MPLLLSLPSVATSCHVEQVMAIHKTASLGQSRTYFHCKTQRKSLLSKKNVDAVSSRYRSFSNLKARNCMKTSNELIAEDSSVDYEWMDQDEDGEDISSPWEGAIFYHRNPSISHIEYCTTLERLGLGKLSTEVSKSRASLMGLRVTKDVKDFPLGTPVMVSVDVTRKKQKLRLDGIIRTVITLGCYRCGEPAAECVFSNFSLVLTEEPIEEPEIISFTSSTNSEEQEHDDDASIDLDDWLYFPPQEKIIDISKHIRDLVHLEITINGLCDPMCKGLCLKCGVNLNTSRCSCDKQKGKEKGYGPLGGLKEKMQQQ